MGIKKTSYRKIVVHDSIWLPGLSLWNDEALTSLTVVEVAGE